MALVSPYPLNLFQVREVRFVPLFAKTTIVSSDVGRESRYQRFISVLPYILDLFRVPAEYSLWLCNFLFPIVTWRLFPASWYTVSFCSAISSTLFVRCHTRTSYDTLFSNHSFHCSTISPSLILYARRFGLRKVRSSTSRISKKTWNNVFPFMGEPSKK